MLSAKQLQRALAATYSPTESLAHIDKLPAGATAHEAMHAMHDGGANIGTINKAAQIVANDEAGKHPLSGFEHLPDAAHETDFYDDEKPAAMAATKGKRGRKKKAEPEPELEADDEGDDSRGDEADEDTSEHTAE